MRPILVRLLVAVLTIMVAFISYELWLRRHVFSWPYPDMLCGFDIENPLCGYSSLEEIPTIDFCALITNPKAYDERIIRLRAHYSSVRGSNFSGESLHNPVCEGYDEGIGVGYWDGITISNLRNYFDVFASSSRSVKVTVIGQFFDRAGDGYETLGGSRFVFTILHTESMSPAAPVPPNKALQLTAR